MSNIAIRVEGIGKKYKIGRKKSGDLRESFSHFWNRFKWSSPSEISMKEGFAKATKDDEFWALKDISFEVKQGEAVGIIGRNGAGKSTLLKVLSRITKPTTGRFEINGRVSSLLEVGTGFHPELTGRENIYLNGTILGMRRAEIKIKFDEIIDFSGVEEFIDTPVKHYSSGMKVRLAFSVAAHLEPEILIIDEVLAVGDAEFQKKCLGKMEDVTGEGKTILFVSHNMSAVEILCNKGIVLGNSKLTFKGSQFDSISYYLNTNKKFIQTNLENRKDRKGNQKIKIVSIQYSANKIFQSNNALTGKSLYFNFQYKIQQKIKSERIIVSLLITNSNGQSLILLHNRMTGNAFSELKEEGSIICKIDKLGLLPGGYNITYSIISDGEYIDGITNALYLNVSSGDYFGTGELPNKNQGIFLMDCKWYLEN